MIVRCFHQFEELVRINQLWIVSKMRQEAALIHRGLQQAWNETEHENVAKTFKWENKQTPK